MDSSSQSAIELVQNFFGNIGHIYKNPKKGSVEFVVDSIPEICARVVPHFLEYPLYGEKQQSFQLFMIVAKAIHAKATIRGGPTKSDATEALLASGEDLLSILANTKNSTHGGPKVYTRFSKSLDSDSFWNALREHKLLEALQTAGLIDPNFFDGLIRSGPSEYSPRFADQFIVGLIEGDGCFSVSFPSSHTARLGKILFTFHITGALTENQLSLFRGVQEHFAHCGKITSKHNQLGKYCRYEVNSLADIRKHIIPFMDKYTLYTPKAIHYSKFKQVVELVQNKAHLNQSGFFQIVDIAYEMNLGGKRRKLSKEELLKKYLERKELSS